MSCGIPYFFEPVKLRSLAGKDIVVDGGLLSNFPIWLFENEEKRLLRPLIGIKLSHDQDAEPKKKNITNALNLFEALFVTMKDAHDNRYISRKHEKNIVFIPIENSFTAEFNLTDEKKDALIEKGRSKTEQFLKSWSY